MDSRFKFVHNIDPNAVQSNILKPKFGKLTLATTKTVAVESTNVEMDTVRKTTQTITHTTTTTTTTLPKGGNENGANEKKLETVPNDQKPKLLLYESTILHSTTIERDPDASDLLTDDDTDSVRSSIDSNELEEGMKNISKTQASVINIESIDSQMQILTVQSENQEENDETKMSEMDLVNLSHQLKYLDISQAESKRTNQPTYSIHSLSSNDTFDRERTEIQNRDSTQNSESHDVIVLSDTESEVSNERPEKEEKRRISQEPPLKCTPTSDNDCAAYNISSNEPHKMSSFAMQKVNQFFDNVPFTEVNEHSFNSTLLSRSLKDAVYVSESTDEESSADDLSKCDESAVKESPKRQQEKPTVNDKPENSDNTDKAEEVNELEFSGNNIVFDIPVVKSSSDQPQQLIRSQSGIRLTAFNSSPIIKPSTAITTSASNVVLNKKGSKITVNSNNGQVEISAKININIHISTNEDSSSDASSDKNIPTNRPRITQSENFDEAANQYNKNVNHISGKENRNTPNKQLINNADSPKPNGTPKGNKMPRLKDNEHFQRTIKNPNDGKEQEQGDSRPKSVKKTEQQPGITTPPRPQIILDASYVNDAPRSVKKRDLIKTPAKVLPKTPSAASKLKEFEYVTPKSLTKSSSKSQRLQNTIEKQVKKKHSANETLDKDDSFEVDERIPITPKDQKLLHRVYGNAWKTPEVIRSYSAVKGYPNNINDRHVIKTPKSLRNTRESKGFNLFKRNHPTNLNSTLVEEGAEAEISIIEPPAKVVQSVVTCEKDIKSAKLNTESAQKQQINSPSQSVINKKTSKPVENPCSATKRPQRSARKRIIYSVDEDDEEENCSQIEKNSDDFFSSDMMTDDESDSDFSTKSSGTSKSVMKKGKQTTNPKKKNDKKKLIYLDLSAEEVVEVDDNDQPKMSEEDLVNMTKHFFEDNLDDKEKEKPKKKLGRKLFTPQYDDIDDISPEKTETVRKKIPPSTLIDTDIEIPRFTQTKLFDSKTFGSPSLNRTPDFKTPRSKPIIAPRSISKISNAATEFGTPTKTFVSYGFLKSLDVSATMLLCHPDAKKFRENFKSNKEELTRILYKMYNDDVFDGKLDVDIVWNNKLTKTAGRFIAKSNRKIKTTSIIQLSDKVLTSADRLRCTLIHEMCHAATWIIDKDRGCHGPVWKGWANRANRIYPELPPIQVCHSYNIEYKYTYKCEMCQNKSYSHSKSQKVENIRCILCHGMIGIYLNKKQNGNIVLIPVRQATGFSKYVKEFYKVHKKPGVTHVEVMRTLSAEYAKLSDEEKKKYQLVLS